MKPIKAVILFVASIVMLCVDIEFKSIFTAVFYYGAMLSILFYSVYLITKYRNNEF